MGWLAPHGGRVAFHLLLGEASKTISPHTRLLARMLNCMHASKRHTPPSAPSPQAAHPDEVHNLGMVIMGGV